MRHIFYKKYGFGFCWFYCSTIYKDCTKKDSAEIFWKCFSFGNRVPGRDGVGVRHVVFVKNGGYGEWVLSILFMCEFYKKNCYAGGYGENNSL